jgi:hypothetical protein
MHGMLTTIMLTASMFGLCCTLGKRPRSGKPVAVASMALMLVAMADISIPAVTLLPDVAWLLLLLLAAPPTVGMVRRTNRPSFNSSAQTLMRLHRALTLVAMAAIMLIGGSHFGVGGESVVTDHNHGGGGTVQVLVLAMFGALAYACFTGSMLWQCWPRHRGNAAPSPSPFSRFRRALPLSETASSLVAVAAMAAMAF